MALTCDPKTQDAEVLSLGYKELEASLPYKVASQTVWVTERDCVFEKEFLKSIQYIHKQQNITCCAINRYEHSHFKDNESGST